ncbi:MAG: hypothetical protein A2X37_06195 [Elusimicrobia bacterium GWA2_66_18]|nr:MAG: hypothetical protein A2X37_06195 [Elusimicrobia bacterium GWA2_66_18]
MTTVVSRRIAVVLALLGAIAGIVISQQQMKQPQLKTKLSIAFPPAGSASSYDPMRIHLAYEYVFLANIYSPLVEYSADGRLVSAIAERFEWTGNEARFTIRENLKTIDGRAIDAYDAEAMFKRVLILGGNTHGNLASMLCPGQSLKTLADPCPGMQVRENGRVLTILFEKPMPFFFPMLTAIDFAVIPRDALDPKTLAIRDYRNTSGPYYVEKDSPQGNIELSANPNHFHYSPKMPQELILHPVPLNSKKSSLQLMSEGTVDVVPEVGTDPQEDKIEYAAAHPDVTLHTTLPICFYGVIFTQKGMKRLDLNQRIAIGMALKKLFLKQHAGRAGFEAADQIFPFSGEGALATEQVKTLTQKWEDSRGDQAITEPLSIWNIIKSFNGDDPEVHKAFPNSHIQYIRKVPGLVDYKKEGLDEPDVFLTRTDMSFLEDIGLLSYYSHMDFFSLRGKKAADWLSRYMEVPDKSKRIPMLRDLHYQTLSDAYVIPIAFSPYATIIRKPWAPHLSKMHAGDTLWRLERP